MTGTLSKRCDRRADGRTDRQMEISVLRAAWSQLKTIWHLFYIMSSLVHHFKAMGEFKLELQSGNTQLGSKSVIFFVPCDIEILQMTLKNNRAPLLCYFKLYALFQSHWWIQTWVTVQKHSIRVKIGHFLSLVTLKFGRRSWKTIGHLFYTASSFVHHFIAISESCDLEIWQKTLKINRAPLLNNIKRCVSFHHHMWIQTGVTVQKRQIWVKIDDILSRATLRFDRWPSKTTGHLFYAISSFVHRFKAIGELKLELQSGNTKFGSKLTIFFSCVTLKFDGWPWKSIGHLS